MKLRAQLIVVSLFALFLPWAGCSFVYEMESVLRSGQQDALGAVGESVAMLIEERAVLPAPDAPLSEAGEPVYFFTQDRIPMVDGYPDDDPSGRSVRFDESHQQAAPLSADFLGIVAAGEAYLLVRVEDATIRFRNPADSDVAAGDHILIAIGVAGDTRRYWLAPEAPGEFLARYRGPDGVATESRIRGVWRDTASGYQVEVRLPAAMLGERFGFAVSDGGNASRWVGSMPPRAEPGAVIRTDTELAAMLDTFARDNLRLSVVGTGGWMRARAGGLVYQAPETAGLPPGAWMLETLYRWIMAGDEDVDSFGPETGARIERREVSDALGGVRSSGWYRVDEQRGVAVASVTLPIRANDTVVGALVAEQSSSRILSLTNAAVIRLLALTLVATFLISIGLVLYASLLSMRIRRLGGSVDAALGDDGQIAGDFPTRWARDELGDLGRHFGGLLGRMREYNDYLKSLASKLSHELRTPLAVVSSSLDNLEHESLSGSGQEYMQRARDGAERLSRILTAMSEASRVEQGIRSAEIERLDLAALLANNVLSYRAAFGPQIDYSGPDEAICIVGSADLLAQMLDKLMDNAADFCPEDGRITFALRSDGPHAVLTVDNDGPPLPEQMRGELFESMVSVRPERQDKPHLGLGLTIVRLVAEFHGGTVHAENLPARTGVRFRIELPAE